MKGLVSKDPCAGGLRRIRVVRAVANKSAVPILYGSYDVRDILASVKVLHCPCVGGRGAMDKLKEGRVREWRGRGVNNGRASELDEMGCKWDDR